MDSKNSGRVWDAYSLVMDIFIEQEGRLGIGPLGKVGSFLNQRLKIFLFILLHSA